MPTTESVAAFNYIHSELIAAIENGGWNNHAYQRAADEVKKLTHKQRKELRKVYGQAVIRGEIDPRDRSMRLPN